MNKTDIQALNLSGPTVTGVVPDPPSGTKLRELTVNYLTHSEGKSKDLCDTRFKDASETATYSMTDGGGRIPGLMWHQIA